MEDSTPAGNQEGPGADARVYTPTGITMSPTGNVVVVDRHNHALRLVSKAGAASTPQSSQVVSSKNALSKLAKSGSTRDAAAVFEQFI